jgi:hypothetical protein
VADESDATSIVLVEGVVKSFEGTCLWHILFGLERYYERTPAAGRRRCRGQRQATGTALTALSEVEMPSPSAVA